jgi:hypothetical protein
VRSYRELWLWLGGMLLGLSLFFAAVAMVYFLKEPGYSLFGNFWMIAAWLLFASAFVAFFGALSGRSFPPWESTRFPAIEVEIYGMGSIDTEREGGSGLMVPTRLRSFNARFSNTESARGASLTVMLYTKLIPGSWGRAAEFVSPPPDFALPPSLNLSPMSMPIALAPGATQSGQLIYEIPRYYLDKIDQPMTARLELWDRISGKRVHIPAEIGSYDHAQMIPSSGEAQVLGSEYDGRIALDDDAGQPQPESGTA